jgi:general secretion pathway protein C
MDLVNTTQRLLNLWSPKFELPKWATGFFTQWFPQLVVLLLVVLVGQQAAHLTWRLVPQPTVERIVIQAASGSENPLHADQTPSELAKGIADLHLFGLAGSSKATAIKVADSKAPETSLNLTLYGVFAEDEPEVGAAIIGKEGLTQSYYRVGSEILSGVKLQAVYRDRVVLSRGSQSEVLKFPKTIKPLGDANAVQNPLPDNQAGSNSLKSYRDQFRDEPLKIFQYVRFVPVRSGQNLKGYRVLPQKDRDLYNQLGLRPSDLVTAVNGVSLSDDKEAMKLIDQLKDADQVTLEILRKGQPQSLSISLN